VGRHHPVEGGVGRNCPTWRGLRPPGLIHAPNESVDPREIENMALVEASFLQKYAIAALLEQ
jgi:acetylornithine deacetylase/succinyl-diaminopimelate desuccinylase-like protein